ncbi:MAG: hypothetical protein JRI92_08150 [Deltaproteobacteria bacterium]|nr:hypothetical protein [Deltaproteobacteria bacterium]MBW2590315.1 hypothetical protein [Deltaproteobacteria bacterium]
MYSLVSEKPLRLAPQGHFLRGVYEPFYLAIGVYSKTFYEFMFIDALVKNHFSVWIPAAVYPALVAERV